MILYQISKTWIKECLCSMKTPTQDWWGTIASYTFLIQDSHIIACQSIFALPIILELNKLWSKGAIYVLWAPTLYDQWGVMYRGSKCLWNFQDNECRIAYHDILSDLALLEWMHVSIHLWFKQFLKIKVEITKSIKAWKYVAGVSIL